MHLMKPGEAFKKLNLVKQKTYQTYESFPPRPSKPPGKRWMVTAQHNKTKGDEVQQKSGNTQTLLQKVVRDGNTAWCFR